MGGRVLRRADCHNVRACLINDSDNRRPRRRGREISKAASRAYCCAAAAAAPLALAAQLLQPATASAALPNPVVGAEGFGANATGGRGGDVYHVTTLADDPSHLIPGSLFYGLYEKNIPAAGRTIVFDVCGTIKLGSSTLDIKNIKNVTIAGQTAPSPITIVGNTVQITSSSGKETGNIILQHVAIRKGLANSGDALSIKGSGNTNNILVDHVSGSWSEDEVISVAGATNHATNVSVQYSTMSEALTSGHQYGALIRNNQNASVSYGHNLFSNNVSRNPRPGTYLGTQLDFEFQNNVIYNWKDRAGYTGGASESDVENVNMNYVGNYLIAGPSTVGGPTAAGDSPAVGARRNTAFTKDASGDPLNLKVYQSGNKIDWAAGATLDGQDIGWTAFASWNGTSSSAFPAGDRLAAPFAYPAQATADSADAAYAKVIGAVGAFPWARTTTDQRLINEVLTYAGTSGQTAPNAAEWAALDTAPAVTRPANWDTDLDGMPNWWETARELNPSSAAGADGNNGVSANGLTNLENYLRYLNLQAAWGGTGGGAWSDQLNWRGFKPGEADTTARFGPTIAAPSMIAVDSAVTVGQISFDSAHAYTIGGANAITMDVVSGRGFVDVLAGSHTISAPLALAKPVTFTVASGSTLTTSALQPTASAITKDGAGVMAVNNLRTGGLTVAAGTVQVQANGGSSGTSKIAGTLNVTAAGAKLDLTDNKLIVTAGTLGSWNGSGYTGITGRIASGRNGGAWNGDGIMTSKPDAAGGLTTLAVATASANRTFGGLSASAGDVLVMYTYAGDANLDGRIDGDDYFAIDSNAGLVGGAVSYGRGDFNYDGKVNGDDYFIIDSNAGRQTLGTFSTSAAPDLAVVPEPLALPVVLLAAARFAARRRRRRGSDIA
jgi:hypothetical protein